MSHDHRASDRTRRVPESTNGSVRPDGTVAGTSSLPQRPREDVATRAARVKAACRIEEVIRAAGVRLAPAGGGQRLVGLCPFHAEEHASFTVYPDTQSFCCYGCHAAGDVITFVCLFEDVRFDEALRRLGETREDPALSEVSISPPHVASLLPFPTIGIRSGWIPSVATERHSDHSEHFPGSPATREQQGQLERLEQQRDARGNDGADDADESAAALRVALLCATTALAMQGLLHAPPALCYLGERGISLELARRCRLGYLDDAVLLDYLAGDRELRLVAQQLGLLNRRQRGALARRLIVPEVRRGRTTQLIGRVLPGARTPLGDIKYYLVCDREKGLLGYGAALDRIELSAQKRAQAAPHTQLASASISASGARGILVMEGALDYVIASGWDLPVLPIGLLAAYPSQTQLRELLDLHARSGGLPLLLMLDADSAGRGGSDSLQQALRKRRVPFRLVPPLPRLPTASMPYKDLGELGPLGHAGRAYVHTAIERALERFTEARRDDQPGANS